MRIDAHSGKKELAALLQLYRDENYHNGSQAVGRFALDRAQSIATTWPANGVVSIRKHLFTSIRLLATTGLLWALATRADLSRAAQLLRQVALSAFGGHTRCVPDGESRRSVALAPHLVGRSPGPAVLLKIVLVGLFFNQVLRTSAATPFESGVAVRPAQV